MVCLVAYLTLALKLIDPAPPGGTGFSNFHWMWVYISGVASYSASVPSAWRTLYLSSGGSWNVFPSRLNVIAASFPSALPEM